MDVTTAHPICPFPGLRTFLSDDAKLYFGRERQIEQALSKLASRGIVTIMGRSGSGKSSLILAGLLPALQATQHPPGGTASSAVLMRPGRRPMASLAQAIAMRFASAGGPTPDQSESIERRLIKDPKSLSELLRNAAAGSSGLACLVVDQLEEVFRPAGGDATVEPFLHSIVSLLHTPLRQDRALPS